MNRDEMESEYIIAAGNWAGHLATNVRPIEDGAYCSWSRCTITLSNGVPFIVEVRTEWLMPNNG
jgi:hypothetical protein